MQPWERNSDDAFDRYEPQDHDRKQWEAGLRIRSLSNPRVKDPPKRKRVTGEKASGQETPPNGVEVTWQHQKAAERRYA